jgi:hypothetical protein
MACERCWDEQAATGRVRGRSLSGLGAGVVGDVKVPRLVNSVVESVGAMSGQGVT